MICFGVLRYPPKRFADWGRVTNRVLRVAVLGSKQIGVDVAKAAARAQGDTSLVCVASRDDRSDPRNNYSDFLRQRAEGLPVVVAATSGEALDRLVGSQPDLVLVAGWHHLIPSSLLCQVAMGFVGFHYSLLPEYRGSAPLVWALINGESRVGVTVFRLTEGMDEGPIWRQRALHVQDRDSVGTISRKLGDVAVGMVPELLSEAVSPEGIRWVAQPEITASYGGIRTPEDGVIDWTRPAATVANFIRAQSDPYPGAFTTLDGLRMTIWECRRVDMPVYGVPGQVLLVLGGNPIIACGDSRGIELLVVQRAGDCERHAASDVCWSLRTRLGTGPS
ncbi:MAG: methionyl-tRNA formyltransferase [Actinomycetota bacterium]|nr:methionyl-tRNA formyltransferase [Actinomycetota bacterium]